MRVLVTGGHGFVGSHLVDRLLEGGDQVRILYRHRGRPPSLQGRAIEVFPGDARDPGALREALDGVDEVYHLAALTRSRTRREMMATNVGATRALVDTVAKRRLSGRLVFCSSLAAIGPSPDGHDLTEVDPPHPVTWYGESKALAERVVRERGRDIDHVIVRPPAVYGPRDRDFLAVFKAASRGVLPLLGTGPKDYHFIHATDLAAALVVAARHPRASQQTYFAAHPERLSMSAFLRCVARAVGRPRARVFRVPDSTLALAANLSEVLGQWGKRPPLLNRQRLLELAGRAYVCSPAALEAATGWRAVLDADAGTRATAAWYEAQGWLPKGRSSIDAAPSDVDNPTPGTGEDS